MKQRSRIFRKYDVKNIHTTYVTPEDSEDSNKSGWLKKGVKKLFTGPSEEELKKMIEKEKLKTELAKVRSQKTKYQTSAYEAKHKMMKKRKKDFDDIANFNPWM